MANKVMMTIQLDPTEATLAGVKRKLNLAQDEIDEDFGVVSIRPKDNLYVLLIDEDAATRLTGTPGVYGPYSNPRIEAFGPPRT